MLYIYIYIYVFSKKNILYNSYLNRNIFKKKFHVKFFLTRLEHPKTFARQIGTKGICWLRWATWALLGWTDSWGLDQHEMDRTRKCGHEMDMRRTDGREMNRTDDREMEYDQWSGDAIWSDIDPKKWRWRPGHGNLSIRAFCSTKWTKQQNGLDNYQLDRTQEVVSQDKTSAAQDGMDNQAHDPLVCYIGQMTKSG